MSIKIHFGKARVDVYGPASGLGFDPPNLSIPLRTSLGSGFNSRVVFTMKALQTPLPTKQT